MIGITRRVLAGPISLGCAFALVVPGSARAHEAPVDTTARSVCASTTALRLSDDLAPLVARYTVTVVTAQTATGHPTARVTRHDWYFLRDARQVALLKGPIDEIWRRDDQGRLSFERALHDDRRVVDYSAGELATLGIRADWRALASFADPAALAALCVVSRTGAGPGERVRLAGKRGGDTLRVDWIPALQLPARLLRIARTGVTTEINLVQHATTAPTGWPAPGLRSAEYLRLDAADFGDMEHEAVVRKSEALDARLGWRSAHQHK